MRSKEIRTRCILDSTFPDVDFDENGVCDYCKIHDSLMEADLRGEKGCEILEKTISKVQKDGRNKEYDCIVGVSDGTDSTYLISYLKSSVPWADNPTDIGITELLYKVAAEEKIRYIFVGNDFRIEGKQSTEWGLMRMASWLPPYRKNLAPKN